MSNPLNTHYGPGRRFASIRTALKEKYGQSVQFVQSLQESQFEFQYKTEQCRYFHATGEVINVSADTWQERLRLLMQTIQEKTHAQH